MIHHMRENQEQRLEIHRHWRRVQDQEWFQKGLHLCGADQDQKKIGEKDQDQGVLQMIHHMRENQEQRLEKDIHWRRVQDQEWFQRGLHLCGADQDQMKIGEKDQDHRRRGQDQGKGHNLEQLLHRTEHERKLNLLKRSHAGTALNARPNRLVLQGLNVNFVEKSINDLIN